MTPLHIIMSNEKMFLFWGSGSAPCWKAMIVLQEKGLWKNIPTKLLEFSKKEHKGDDVLKWNPRGQVGEIFFTFGFAKNLP